MATRTKEQTSYIMSRIRGKDSVIEVTLRKELWRRNMRYRKNVRKVRGTPDIAFIGLKIAVFVDGEFWHGYDWETRKAALKTNREYWVAKIERNMERDREVNEALEADGWTVIRVWGSEITHDVEGVADRIELVYQERRAEKASKAGGTKAVDVVAALIVRDSAVLATQRGYGSWEGWWEFPGGKVEAGETSEEALAREIREELDAEIEVGDYLCTAEYDYPEFHLSMKCYVCRLIDSEFQLLEHHTARWLTADTIDEVKWLPADVQVIERLKRELG